MKKTKKFWAVLAAAGLLAASFAGCGSNASASAGSSSGSAASSSADGSSASDSGEKKVIKAVTSGTLAPYFYVNDDNELTGVDIDIVKEVFNRLPQYEFQIENMELANISVALDAKKVSIGSQQFEKNPPADMAPMDIPMREQNPTTSLYHIKPASTNTFREPAMSR